MVTVYFKKKLHMIRTNDITILLLLPVDLIFPDIADIERHRDVDDANDKGILAHQVYWHHTC